MNALYVADDDVPARVVVGEAARPVPADSELLIRVCAAGVTPTELLWYPTSHTKDGAKRTRAIPGHEFSGVVAGVGSEVHGFAVGDEVYGMNDWFQQGATAEFCVATPSGVARKPSTLSHPEAAVVPIAALTAWQGLFTRGDLKAGDRLLVHGGSGSVGGFVIQLAKLHGAYVIATASGKNLELVRSLKADQVIDYETTRFEEVASDLDMVFDTVGGDSLDRSWTLLKPGGRAVTIAADVEGTSDPRAKAAFFIVEQSHEQLADLGPLLEAGSVRAFVGLTASLENAPELYGGTAPNAPAHGKAVVILPGTGH